MLENPANSGQTEIKCVRQADCRFAQPVALIDFGVTNVLIDKRGDRQHGVDVLKNLLDTMAWVEQGNRVLCWVGIPPGAILSNY